MSDVTPEVELFRCTTQVSRLVLGVLLVGPVVLIGLGVLTNRVAPSLLSSLPFLGAFVALLFSRKTTTVTTDAVHIRRFNKTRTLLLSEATSLTVPHESGAALAVTAGSRLAAALLLTDRSGSCFALPAAIPNEVLRQVVARALPPALTHAEELVASGGRYTDLDGFSGIDNSCVHGMVVGLRRTPCSTSFAQVLRISSAGRVERNDGEPFFVGVQDLVLSELLRRRGIQVVTPWSVSSLTMNF